MNLIIRYILKMLPYIAIATPIYILIRFIILKIKSKKINWYHEFGLFIFIMYLVGLASLTIIPKIEINNFKINIINIGTHRTNLIPFKILIDTYYEVFKNDNINYFIFSFLGNILFFVPIGFLLPLAWRIDDKKVILTGFFISLFIELCQLFLPRGTDIDDIILNLIGTIIGLLIYKILYKIYKKVMNKFKLKKEWYLISKLKKIFE